MKILFPTKLSNFLKKRNLRDIVINENIKYFSKKGSNESTLYISTLSEGFIWRNSQKGYNFWDEINKEAMKTGVYE